MYICILSICLIIPITEIKVNAKIKDQSMASTQMIDGPGGIGRTRNVNDYVGYSNGSFVLYLTHSKAIEYKNNLMSSYTQGLASEVWTFVGFVLGASAGIVVTIGAANITLSTATQAFISSGISTFGTWLAQKNSRAKNSMDVKFIKSNRKCSKYM